MVESGPFHRTPPAALADDLPDTLGVAIELGIGPFVMQLNVAPASLRPLGPDTVHVRKEKALSSVGLSMK